MDILSFCIGGSCVDDLKGDDGGDFLVVHSVFEHGVALGGKK